MVTIKLQLYQRLKKSSHSHFLFRHGCYLFIIPSCAACGGHVSGSGGISNVTEEHQPKINTIKEEKVKTSFQYFA